MSVDRVYLYGSYANRTAQWDSDVDLCFFSRSFAAEEIMNIIGRLFELKRKYNQYICLEPNAFPASELDNDNPFVKEILRTGQEINLPLGMTEDRGAGCRCYTGAGSASRMARRRSVQEA